MRPPDEAARRTARLLLWYPKAWRSRYGEEFAELLMADICERPRSRMRTADVVRGGIVARLSAAGLCGWTLEPAAQVRASLVSLGWCAAAFVSVGAAIWSQLTIGWQWSQPDTPAAAVAAAGAAGFELISRGILPGKTMLDTLDGACSVPSPPLMLAPPGPSSSGTFYSMARRRTVGYTIAYPPGHRAGDELPLVVMLHGYGGNHADALVGMTPAQAMALRVDGRPPAAMAMVTVDGGNGYWNPHPGDDPMAMVIGELIPLCRRLGLGRPPRPIATMGISMGGYGALLLAEKYPHLIAAVAAISPAIWTSYTQARGANAGAYASAAAFAANDAVIHAPALARVPVRVASGDDDPFYPGVRALARALPAGAVVDLGAGCHTGAFFAAQEPPSLAFLARHLAGLPGWCADPESRHREQRPLSRGPLNAWLPPGRSLAPDAAARPGAQPAPGDPGPRAVRRGGTRRAGSVRPRASCRPRYPDHAVSALRGLGSQAVRVNPSGMSDPPPRVELLEFRRSASCVRLPI
ncbi:MAG: alpha/beta hydrolase [Streptosporangiaceae bacterium]